MSFEISCSADVVGLQCLEEVRLYCKLDVGKFWQARSCPFEIDIITLGTYRGHVMHILGQEIIPISLVTTCLQEISLSRSALTSMVAVRQA